MIKTKNFIHMSRYSAACKGLKTPREEPEQTAHLHSPIYLHPIPTPTLPPDVIWIPKYPNTFPPADRGDTEQTTQTKRILHWAHMQEEGTVAPQLNDQSQ